MKSGPRLPQLEKALAKKWRPNAAKKKKSVLTLKRFENFCSFNFILIARGYIDTHTHIYVYIHECICDYINTHTFINIYTYAQTCIHTHTHTHTYIPVFLGICQGFTLENQWLRNRGRGGKTELSRFRSAWSWGRRVSHKRVAAFPQPEKLSMSVKPEMTNKRHMNDTNRYILKTAELENTNIRDGVNNNNEGCQD